MKFCPNCGRSCSPQARFCMNCGYSFDENTAPLRAPAQPQRPVAQPAPQPVPPQPPYPPVQSQPVQPPCPPVQNRPVQPPYPPVQNQPVHPPYPPVQNQPVQPPYPPVQNQPVQPPYPPVQNQPVQPPVQQPPRPPMPPVVDPAKAETASSDQFAFYREESSDFSATATTFSGYRAPVQTETVKEETDWNQATPKMSRGLWNGLLFGAIGLSVLTLVAAIIFYYSNLWI